MQTTFDPMPDEARELLDAGEDVTLYDWHNAAAGFGFNVHCLVRRGLWERKHRHVADDPMASWTRYGPKASSPFPAAPVEAKVIS